jgi:hypothetical protein
VGGHDGRYGHHGERQGGGRPAQVREPPPDHERGRPASGAGEYAEHDQPGDVVVERQGAE